MDGRFLLCIEYVLDEVTLTKFKIKKAFGVLPIWYVAAVVNRKCR